MLLSTLAPDSLPASHTYRYISFYAWGPLRISSPLPFSHCVVPLISHCYSLISIYHILLLSLSIMFFYILLVHYVYVYFINFITPYSASFVQSCCHPLCISLCFAPCITVCDNKNLCIPSQALPLLLFHGSLFLFSVGGLSEVVSVELWEFSVISGLLPLETVRASSSEALLPSESLDFMEEWALGFDAMCSELSALWDSSWLGRSFLPWWPTWSSALLRGLGMGLGGTSGKK